jgi:hypothetical protein
LYIKVDTLSDKRIGALQRIALLHPGDVSVVLFDTSKKKYVALKDAWIDPNDAVLSRLRSMFAEDGVVYRRAKDT